MPRTPGVIVPQSSSEEDLAKAIEAVRKGGETAGYDSLDLAAFGDILAQSGAMEFDEFIEHFGIKGMKWGVRRADKKFEKKANSNKLYYDVYDGGVKAYNSLDLDRINNKPQYKDKDFSQPSALRTRYYREHNAAFQKRLNDTAIAKGTNKSGTRRYNVVMEENGDWDIHTMEVKHADNEQVAKVHVTYDDKGHVTSIELMDELTQEDSDEDYIVHFGVKGMRWGVKKAKEHLSTAGDAKESDKLATRAKVGGARNLSNDEMSKVIKRMELEKKYKELKGSNSWKQAGLKYAGEILKGAIGSLLVSVVNDKMNGRPAGSTAYSYAYAGARVLGVATRAITR